MNEAFPIVILVKEGRIVARNRRGAVIAVGAACVDDSRVFQAAVDSLAPNGGEIRIAQGRYRFSDSVLIDLPITVTGEGQNTTLVPPPDDYVFKVMMTERSPLRPNCGDKYDASLTGVTIQMLTVDGERAGKGFFLHHIFDCLFQNLWMHDIHRGSALHLDWVVAESNFVNIHLNGTGCKETGAPSIKLSAGHTANNLHFNRVYTIFPQARGLEVLGGTILYFNDCMWHGHFPYDTDAGKRLMPREWPKDFSQLNIRFDTEELIYVKEVNYERGLTFSRPRLTNNHPDYCHIVVEKGTVSVLDGIIGGGAGGDAMIRAETDARMRIVGNYFQGFGNFTHNALRCNGAEVVFRDNVIGGRNERVLLAPAKRSIITGNRFANTTEGASLRALDDGSQGCEHVIIADNIFQESQAGAAIEISELSRSGVTMRDNCFAGHYSGDPVRYV